ncbi:MAG: hypothetical protein PVH84_04480 [Candidatus Aminicenantes bacterium]|jgi:hypothetical protein
MENAKYKTCVLLAVIFILGSFLLASEDQKESGLISLLPELESWSMTEKPESYYPENLFEYINGAAEIYLAYEFKELIVAQQQKDQSEKNVAVEIYDMGTPTNAFGIYSAERYPDNRFIRMGLQGYVEEGTLNFLVNRYYIKLLCFECEDQSEEVLKAFSSKIVERVKEVGTLPSLLTAFPSKGLHPNSESFVLRNFMGYSFLHNGYSAKYRVGDLEFDCFIAEGEDKTDAEVMLQKYLEAKESPNVQKIDSGYHIKDKYYHNIYMARVDKWLCGVIKIEDGSEDVGLLYLKDLIQSLKNLTQR